MIRWRFFKNEMSKFNHSFKKGAIVLIGLVSLCPLLPAQSNPCDLNGDGVVNSTDVTLAVNMALGTTTCTANLEGADVCTVITVQRVVNASLGGTCIAYNTHAVTINWTASTSPGIAGYDVFRATNPSGPYTQINSSLVTGTTFKDTSVTAGITYYYVATAVNSSGVQSSYSSQVSATIPTP